MEYLSEDPTLLAGLLVLAAGAFVLAMRATQQGKYLIRALIAAALALAVVVVEWLWVTDNERIEQVVYALRDAVAGSDAEGVIDHLTPDVMYVKGDVALEGEATRGLIRDNLGRVRFEIVRIRDLRTTVAPQSRRGTAMFNAFFKGTMDGTLAPVSVGAINSTWSLGLQETQPGVWKVNRITPVQVPGDGLHIPGGGRRAAPTATGPSAEEIWSRRSSRAHRP